jgi:hypothetical protein
MMKISTKKFHQLLKGSLIKTNKKKKISALDYKISRPFKIKN